MLSIDLRVRESHVIGEIGVGGFGVFVCSKVGHKLPRVLPDLLNISTCNWNG